MSAIKTERWVPKRSTNPLAAPRRGLGLTRWEFAVLSAPKMSTSVAITQMLQSILLVEMGARLPPNVPIWDVQLRPVLKSIGVNVEKLERDLAAWAGKGVEPNKAPQPEGRKYHD